MGIRKDGSNDPDSITFCMSSEGVVLGQNYGIDQFVLRNLKYGDLDKIIRGLTPEVANTIIEYVDTLRLKLRSRYSNGELILQFTTTLHEEVSAHLASMVTTYNNGLGGNTRTPIRNQGTATVTGNNFNAMPDLRTISDPQNRFMNSPNCVYEINFLSSQTSQSFADHMIAYITQTQDVFVSVGIKIYPRRVGGLFAALCFVYLRTLGTNDAVLQSLTSFGTAPLEHLALTTWQEVFMDHPIRGTGMYHNGVLDPSCNAENAGLDMYNFVIPATHFLSIDALGLVYPAGFGVADYAISLADLQAAIIDAFIAMFPEEVV